MSALHTEIANRAIDFLSGDPIVSIDDAGSTARACKRNIGRCIDLVLRDHLWNDALKRWSIGADATAPAFGPGRRFLLPADCLRVVEVNGEPIASADAQVEDGFILTDEAAPLEVLYIRRITDTAQIRDPHLFEAMARYLAVILAPRLADDAGEAERQMKAYERVARNARSIDAMEGRAASSAEAESISVRG